MKDLTRRQRFDNKVLICTSVLDNGISFVDDSLYEDGKGFELVVKELTHILEEYVGRNIDNQEGMKEIDERLQKYYRENPVPSCNLTLKKDGNRSAEHINEFIKTFKLPFSLGKKGEKAKSCYFISKRESTD